MDSLNYDGGATLTEEEHEALSKIIEDLNTRFNTSFTDDEVMVIRQLEKKISEDLVHDNFKFHQKVSDEPEVSKEVFSRLFEWYAEGRKKTPPKGVK